MRRPYVFLTVLLLAAGVAWAADLTIDDLVNLKRAGFSEAEIRQEIDRGDARLALQPADAETLRRAGFSADFIRGLSATPSRGLGLEAIRKLSREGTPPKDIIARILGADVREAITPAQAVELARGGVAPAVLLVLRGEPLQLDGLITLVGAGVDEAGLAAVLQALGASFQPDAAQTLALTRAGVPASIVKRLREGGTTRGGWVHYEHPNQRFGLDHPAAWRSLVHVAGAELTLDFLFTPDRDTPEVEKIATGFSVVPIALDADSPLTHCSLEDVARRLLPPMLAAEPGLRQRAGSGITTGTVAGQPSCRVEIEGETAARPGVTARAWVDFVRKDRHLYLASAFAPAAAFDDHAATFERMQAGVRFGPIPFEAPRRETSPQTWVEEHKDSVVLVLTDLGGGSLMSGTGFVVRSDGYVLTNHHVVWDKAKQAYARDFTLQWDSSVDRKPVKAVLVGAQGDYLEGRGRGESWSARGTDIALLKIVEPGEYHAVPLAPLDNVRLSDPVLTLGFPMVFRFGFENLSLFVTRGVVTRFNKDARGEIESIFIDAKITHGNSGGPCVDLATGAVIGLNTWGWDIAVGLQDRKLESDINSLVGYHGVVPIDAAMHAFPEFLLQEAGFDRGWTAADHFTLAVDLAGQERMDGAKRQLERTLALDAGHVDARFLLAAIALQAEEYDVAAEQAERLLRVKADHYPALVLLAQIYGGRGDFARSAQYADRAVAAEPDSPFPYLTRAQLMMAVERYADALKDVDRARDKGHGVLPAPDLLAGEVHFAQQRYDEGLARFRLALAIDPANFEGLMAQGRYYELTQKFAASTIEYGKVEARYPRAPEPTEALGRAYIGMQDPEKAGRAFDSAFLKYVKLKRTPPESVFEGMLSIVLDVQGNLELGNRILVGYLDHWPLSANAHARMAAWFQRAGRNPGLAHAHALLARMAAPQDEGIAQRLAGIPVAPLELADVDTMMEMGYRIVALAVAQVAPLGMQIDRAKVEARKDKLGPLLLRVLQIILQRQEQGGGNGGGAREGARPPEGPQTGPQAGVWQAPDGSMAVAIPPGYEASPADLETLRQGLGALVLHYLVRKDPIAEIYVLGFDRQVPDIAQAFGLLQQRFQQGRAQVVKLTGEQAVRVGEAPASMGQGTLTNEEGTEWRWEMLLAPTKGGIRGVFYLVVSGQFDAQAAERKGLFDGLRLATADAGGPPPVGPGAQPPVGPGGQPPADPGGRPPEGGRATRSWRSANGSMSLQHPASFVPNEQSLAEYHQRGVRFVQYLAGDADSDADILVADFGRGAGTVRQALEQLARFEASVGWTLNRAAEQEQRQADGSKAVLMVGTNTHTDGTRLLWEALFLLRPSGVKVVMFTAPEATFQPLLAVRQALFQSVRVNK